MMVMRHFLRYCLGLAWSLALLAADVGHIQVKCDPGTQVYLDGVYMGEAEPDLGLVLRDLAPGKHNIITVLAGFQAQQAEVTIGKGEVKLIEVKAQPARPAPTEDGARTPSQARKDVGIVTIQSLPVECTIAIPEMKNLKEEKKTKDRWTLGDIPAGRYVVVATALDRELSFDLEVIAGQETRLFFNFLDGRVINLTLVERGALWEKDNTGKPTLVPDLKLEMSWVAALKGWVGRYEISNAQYRLFEPTHDSGRFKQWSLNDDEQPAVNLSQQDALAFIAWLNQREYLAGRLPPGWSYRLPSPEEWQLLAQAGNPARPFPWGETWPPKLGNFRGREVPWQAGLPDYQDNYIVSAPVKHAGRTDWDLHGLAGNVAEWTGELVSNERFLAVRGGSWYDDSAEALRIDYQGLRFRPSDRVPWVGFRVLLLPTPR